MPNFSKIAGQAATTKFNDVGRSTNKFRVEQDTSLHCTAAMLLYVLGAAGACARMGRAVWVGGFSESEPSTSA